MTAQKLPIGIQSFEKIIKEKYIYVDKTRYIVQLLKGQVYFLSRPRRFGKSLFLSTLAAYFRGQKELFKGLYLEKAEEELARQEGREAWQEYPVLYLDLNGSNYKEAQSLAINLNDHLTLWEGLYGIAPSEQDFSMRFKGVIRRAYEKTGRQVVILIDEYDKLLLDTIEKPELNENHRDILRAFYSVIKSSDIYLRFVFLTGITKFGKVSVFSGLNNLKDISMREDFSAICGITPQELRENLTSYVESLAAKQKLQMSEALEVLKKQYDGYLFGAGGENVYNPFSLLNALDARALGKYWFTTGTPTFLVNYLKKAHYFVPNLEGKVRLSETRFDGFSANTLDPLPILYQTGYLTIKGYDNETDSYRLGFPNNEVRFGFFENLLAGYAPSYLSLGFSVNDFLDAVRAGDVDAFMTIVRSLLASIPYDTAPKEDIELRERDYQIAVYLVFALMGLFTQTEVQNSTGRADCVVITPKFVYVFEFKLWSSGSAQEALQQIIDKGYVTKYESSGKELILVGASFDEAKRNIGEWEVRRSESANRSNPD